jgi:hypothetical protein
MPKVRFADAAHGGTARIAACDGRTGGRTVGVRVELVAPASDQAAHVDDVKRDPARGGTLVVAAAYRLSAQGRVIAAQR